MDDILPFGWLSQKSSKGKQNSFRPEKNYLRTKRFGDAHKIITLNDRKQNGMDFYVFDLSLNMQLYLQINNAYPSEL